MLDKQTECIIGTLLFICPVFILFILIPIIGLIKYGITNAIATRKIYKIINKKRKRIYLFDNNFYKEDEQWQKDYAQALKEIDDV